MTSLKRVVLGFKEVMLQYAQRAALVYESDQVIQQTAGPGTRITISPSTALGVKAFVETDDTKKVQWVVVVVAIFDWQLVAGN